MRRVVAHTISQALEMTSSGQTLKGLRLRASEDLVCRNIMCGQVGLACPCRLTRLLSKHGHLLEELDLGRNGLSEIPPAALSELSNLEFLNVAGNPMASSAILAAAKSLPCLRRLTVSSDQVSGRAFEDLRKEMAHVDISLETMEQVE